LVIKLTWKNIDYAVDELCEYFDSSMYDAVYGIANGGIIPATLVANRLGIKVIHTIQKNVEIRNLEYSMENYNSVLIIDDINDTGKTLSKFMHLDKYPYSVATLYQRDGTKWPNVLYGENIPFSDWVEFPWENYDNEIPENNSRTN